MHLMEIITLVNLSKDSECSIKLAWCDLRRRKKEVNWHYLVWHKKYIIPRHFFILWMVIKNRLPIRDKLLRCGIPTSSTCGLCNCLDETIDLLFFQCDYCKFIWDAILKLCNRNYNIHPWDNYVENMVVN